MRWKRCPAQAEGRLRNSDVGAAALSLEMFLFRAVCENHIIWGLQHVVGFRRRHVGASIHEAWHDSLTQIAGHLDAGLDADRTRLLRATSREPAASSLGRPALAAVR